MTSVAGVALAAALIAAAQAPGVLAATPSPTPSAPSSPTASASPPSSPTAGPPSDPPHAHPPPDRLAQAPRPILPPPRSNCPSPPGSNVVVHQVAATPWAQQALALPDAWKVSRGAGITVAVVDSGVGYSPQLAHRVTAATFAGSGYQDCVGHGTIVAGIIAASHVQGLRFAGVAPAATILSVKVTDSETYAAAALAEGIRYAALHGAKVINVSATVKGSNPALLSAVRFALGRKCLLVASAGNDQGGKGPFYPASYRFPGLISVGAETHAQALASFSDRLSGAQVTAPGDDLTSIWPGGRYITSQSGTSFSSAFVSGVAALVWSHFRHMKAAGVAYRIEATADGGIGPGSGKGMVDPVRALTALITSGGSQATPSPQPVTVPGAPTHAPEPNAAAAAITLGSLAGAGLVAIGAVVIRQGRRRRWRPGRVQFPGSDGP